MTKRHDIIWLEKAESTNEVAKRDIASLDNLSVVAAIEQTCGRGQHGNVWKSAPGKNLTFSVILKSPPIAPKEQFAISQIAALAITDILSDYGIQAEIKWPNDIYCGNNKICGILIENSLSGEAIRSSIIGIGLNVAQDVFPTDIPNPTSMYLETGEEFALEDVLEKFMDIFKEYASSFLHINGGLLKIRKLYQSILWRKDEEHLFFDLRSGSTISGKIKGVSDQGLLIIEDTEGILHQYAFQEVRYIL